MFDLFFFSSFSGSYTNTTQSAGSGATITGSSFYSTGTTWSTIGAETDTLGVDGNWSTSAGATTFQGSTATSWTYAGSGLSSYFNSTYSTSADGKTFNGINDNSSATYHEGATHSDSDSYSVLNTWTGSSWVESGNDSTALNEHGSTSLTNGTGSYLHYVDVSSSATSVSSDAGSNITGSTNATSNSTWSSVGNMNSNLGTDGWSVSSGDATYSGNSYTSTSYAGSGISWTSNTSTATANSVATVNSSSLDGTISESGSQTSSSSYSYSQDWAAGSWSYAGNQTASADEFSYTSGSLTGTFSQSSTGPSVHSALSGANTFTATNTGSADINESDSMDAAGNWITAAASTHWAGDNSSTSSYKGSGTSSVTLSSPVTYTSPGTASVHGSTTGTTSYAEDKVYAPSTTVVDGVTLTTPSYVFSGSSSESGQTINHSDNTMSGSYISRTTSNDWHADITTHPTTSVTSDNTFTYSGSQTLDSAGAWITTAASSTYTSSVTNNHTYNSGGIDSDEATITASGSSVSYSEYSVIGAWASGVSSLTYTGTAKDSYNTNDHYGSTQTLDSNYTAAFTGPTYTGTELSGTLLQVKTNGSMLSTSDQQTYTADGGWIVTQGTGNGTVTSVSGPTWSVSGTVDDVDLGESGSTQTNIHRSVHSAWSPAKGDTPGSWSYSGNATVSSPTVTHWQTSSTSVDDTTYSTMSASGDWSDGVTTGQTLGAAGAWITTDVHNGWTGTTFNQVDTSSTSIGATVYGFEEGFTDVGGDTMTLLGHTMTTQSFSGGYSIDAAGSPEYSGSGDAQAVTMNSLNYQSGGDTYSVSDSGIGLDGSPNGFVSTYTHAFSASGDHLSSNTIDTTYALGTDNHWTVGPTTDTVSGHMNDTYTYSSENYFNDEADEYPVPQGGLSDDATLTYVEQSNTTYGGKISSDSANPGSITAVTNASGHLSLSGVDDNGYAINQTQVYTLQQNSLQIGNNSPTLTGSETVTTTREEGGDYTDGPLTITDPLTGFYPDDLLVFYPPEFTEGYSSHVGQVVEGAAYAYQIGSAPVSPSAPTLLSKVGHGVLDFVEGKDHVWQSIGNAISNAYWGLGSFLVNNPYAKYIPVLGSITSMYMDYEDGNYLSAAKDFGFAILDVTMVGDGLSAGLKLGGEAAESLISRGAEDLATDATEDISGNITREAGDLEADAVNCANPPDGCFVAGTLVVAQRAKEPIESLRIGRRIIADQTAILPTAIVPADYRVINLRYVKPGTVQTIELSLLRPVASIGKLQAGNHIKLKVVELEMDGTAKVLGVDPCPPIEEGEGSVITGTMHSENADLRQLKLEGLYEPIELTATHPVYSEDREQFLPASELACGERLKTLTGVAIVEEVRKLPGTWTIYNLEIEDVHQYHVSEKEVLVHNAGECLTGMAGGDAAEGEATGTDLARQLGQEGEEAANIVKNTERIPSVTGTANYRIPDVLDHVEQLIGEVKNVATQGFTRQIQDSLYYALQNSYDFVLIVRQNTTFTAPLQALIDNGFVNILRLLP